MVERKVAAPGGTIRGGGAWLTVGVGKGERTGQCVGGGGPGDGNVVRGGRTGCQKSKRKGEGEKKQEGLEPGRANWVGTTRGTEKDLQEHLGGEVMKKPGLRSRGGVKSSGKRGPIAKGGSRKQKGETQRETTSGGPGKKPSTK